MSKLEWFLVKVKKTFSAISSVQQGFDYFKDTCWTQSEVKTPRVMLGENEKIGPMPSNNHITCSESKVAHQTIGFLRSSKNNVKFKVIIHRIRLSRFKTICNILCYLDICKKAAALFVFYINTVFDVFSGPNLEISSESTGKCHNQNKCQHITF